MERTSRGPIVASLAVCLALGVMHGETARAEESVGKDDTMYGVGVRLRYIHIPRQALELFVERSGGSASHPGFGIELIREKGDMAFTIGVEYDTIAPRDGVFIEKGTRIPDDPVDYVEFQDFSWLAVDVSFIGQQPIIGDVLALRYGAGLGLGYIMGDILRTDYVCTSDDVESCMPDGNAQAVRETDVPPVFPLINVILGVQVRPFDNVAINIEGGLRTVPFVGTTAAVLF